MKSFIKTTLAVILGIFISIMLGVVIISSLGVTSEPKSIPTTNGVLSIDLSKLAIVEQTRENNPFQNIKSENLSNLGILDAMRAIDKASIDPNIKFVLLKPDKLNCGIAQLEELRIALEKCRQNGKAVISYMECPGNGSYYLGSVADKIYLNDANGFTYQILGLSSQLFFIKDLLDKLGINVQLIRHGKYKSAGEMFIRNSISDENRAQYECLLNTIWNGWTEKIANSRDISQEAFNSLVNDIKLLEPEDFMLNHLVDELVSNSEFHDKLCQLCEVSDYKDINFVSLADYAEAKVINNFRAKERLAIIYADGEISEGNDHDIIDGDKFASILEKVRKDESVKAVVLRVNSPGGSVSSSDKIREELEKLKESKTVVASYGNYAASGGYWISCKCDKIFSDAGTLTGSIGVFSMIPDLSKTMNNIAHVNVVNINTNKHSDSYGLMRPLDNEEKAYAQKSVDNIYNCFTSLVAEGRGMSQEAVDEIAQGRVWAGQDAIGIGLVDQIGTLKDAIDYALTAADSETEADIDSWDVVSYPKPLSTIDLIMENFGMNEEENAFASTAMEGTPLLGAAKSLKSFFKPDYGKVYARLPYEVTIK